MYPMLWVAYGGWLFTQIIQAIILYWYEIPVSPLQLVAPWMIAIMWYTFHQLAQLSIKRRGEMIDSILELNDAMFKDMEAQRRYMLTRESMRE